VNKEIREVLRIHHSSTHVIAADARKVLGGYVWQNGAKKTKSKAHIDFTNYELPSFEQIIQIETETNLIIFSDAKVKKSYFERKEAKSKWRFFLYQGGSIPGNDIHVVDIEVFDI
jgi:alanyl-tRNA synthetase